VVFPEHIAHIENKSHAYILVGKCEGKRPLGIARHG
jgi:hypothetical protein